MALEVTEVTALAGSMLAAVAATASWANVILMRRSLNESVLPSLHITGMQTPPTGPPYGAGGNVTTLHFDVHNAGGGIAKGPVFVLTYGDQYVIGMVAPMIHPGQTYRITTDMRPDAAVEEWSGVVACLDLHNHRRVWRLHDPQPTVHKREAATISVVDIYNQTFPEVDLAAYTQRRWTTKG